MDYIETLRWRGVKPVVTAWTQTYQTGVTLSKAAMREVEQHLDRDPVLGKWFLSIAPTPRTHANVAPG